MYDLWYLYLKFFLNIGQHGQFIAELQGGQHRVLIGQGEVSRTGEASVGIDPWSRVAEGVKLLLVVTGVAAAEVVMGVIDASAFTQQGVNYLVFLAVCCKYHWSHIMGKPMGMNPNRTFYKATKKGSRRPYIQDTPTCQRIKLFMSLVHNLLSHIFFPNVLPCPVLIISVEVIQHVNLSRARCLTMGISECRVTQQGLCDTNITFTYNTDTQTDTGHRVMRISPNSEYSEHLYFGCTSHSFTVSAKSFVTVK